MLPTPLLLLAALPTDPVFDAPLRLLAGEEPLAPPIAAAADVDADGDVDLIRLYTPPGAPRAVHVLPNLGGGALGDVVVTELPGVDALAGQGGITTFARDFDGDGAADLVTLAEVDGEKALLFLAANGDGTFAPPVDLTPLGSLFGFTAMELDGSAPAELALARFEPGGGYAVAVYGFPGGVPAVLTTSPVFPGNGIEQTVAFDLDGTGRDAIAVDTSPAGSFYVLPNLGGVALGAPVSVAVDLDGVALPDRLVPADVDGDADQDLVSLRPDAAQVVLNTGGSLAALPSQAWSGDPLATLGHPSLFVSASAVDWNGDGFEDLVGKLSFATTSSGSQSIALLESAGDGSFLPARWLPDATDESPAGVADLDGDGAPDYVTARAWVPAGTSFATGESIGPREGGFDVAFDANGDGDLDAVPSALVLGPFSTLGTSYADNDGTGHATPAELFATPPLGSNEFAASYAVGGDLDADGRPEVLVRVLEPGATYLDPPVDLGWRRFELVPGGRYELVGSPLAGTGIVVGQPSRFLDVDGDGLQDVALPSGSSYQPGDGAGGLGASVSLGLGGTLLDAADVDGDGDTDVLHKVSFAVELLRADGAGGYAAELLVADGSAATRFLDLDDDGDPDVVAPVSSTWAELQVLENTAGSFAARAPVETGVEGDVTSLVASDVDGDGLSDLVALAAPAATAPGGTTRLVTALRTGPGPQYAEPAVAVAWASSALGDADADGDVDAFGMALIEGRREEGPAAGGLRQYGGPSPGTGGLAPILGATGPLVPGSTSASVRLVGAVGGTVAFFGIGDLEIDLPDVPLPGLSLYVFPLNQIVQIPLSGAPGDPGAGEWSFAFGNLAPLVGLTRYYQVFVLDAGAPQNVAATNGLEVTYGG